MDKAEHNRLYRARKAIADGRPPGRTGRPPTGRKAPKHHGDREGQYRRRMERKRVADGDNGSVAVSALLDEACAIASRWIAHDRRTHYVDPRHDECVGEALLAIVEGRDPGAAVRSWLRAERWHRGRREPLHE